jgi:shikimate kinase
VKTSVALIGFMGVGKSAVGGVLAERLGKKYIETDALIVQKSEKSIPQIFQEEGEIAFRELEIEVIKEVASKNNQVIDCGGGVVLNKINVDRLKQNAIIIWLTASPEVILKRIIQDGERRPLLKGKNTVSEIQAIGNLRKPYYEQAADSIIDTTELEVESVITRITGLLKENENIR